MKAKTQSLLLCVAVLAAASVRANSFAYSYTFAARDGPDSRPEYDVSGTFDGDYLENPLYVGNVSAVTLTINGTTYTNLNQYGRPFIGCNRGNILGNALVSFDPGLNHFLFSISDVTEGIDDAGFNMLDCGGCDLACLFYAPNTESVFDVSVGPCSFTSWSLVDTTNDLAPMLLDSPAADVASVPEVGATVSLLGLALACLVPLRRILPCSAN